jgi:hypothetical protein
MNISFIGTQIEILANPLPRHTYDKSQKASIYVNFILFTKCNYSRMTILVFLLILDSSLVKVWAK